MRMPSLREPGVDLGEFLLRDVHRLLVPIDDYGDFRAFFDPRRIPQYDGSVFESTLPRSSSMFWMSESSGTAMPKLLRAATL